MTLESFANGDLTKAQLLSRNIKSRELKEILESLLE